MERHKYPGLFIALEGLDGSGLSTQAQLLYDRLKADGYKVLLTKEPTNNIIGGLIRGQLTNDWKTGMEALQLLFAADRAHHLEKEIIPALKEKRIVICDRYVFSSVAFGAIDADRSWLIEINQQFIYPDLVIILKLSAEEVAHRLRASRFRMELFEEVEKRIRVAKNYDWIADHFDLVKVIDGNRPIKDVAEGIYAAIKPYLARVSRSG